MVKDFVSNKDIIRDLFISYKSTLSGKDYFMNNLFKSVCVMIL